MAYLTRAEYTGYISTLIASRQSDYTTPETEMIDTLIAQAQGFIEETTGRRFEAATQTRQYDARAQNYSDSRVLMLDDDLISLTTLTNGDGTVIGSTGYVLLPLNQSPKYAVRLKSPHSWIFNDDGLVSVAGTWGFTESPSPLIKRLTARVTRHMEQTRSATGAVQVFEDGTRSFEASLPADVREMLKLHRRPVGNY